VVKPYHPAELLDIVGRLTATVCDGVDAKSLES
jgi:hypothetical protein